MTCDLLSGGVSIALERLRETIVSLPAEALYLVLDLSNVTLLHRLQRYPGLLLPGRGHVFHCSYSTP